MPLTDYQVSKAQSALATVLNLTAMIETPAEANADGIVGVTDELKNTKPVAPILTQEQADQLMAAVKKAALEGRHTVITDILSGVRNVVAKATGLGGIFGSLLG